MLESVQIRRFRAFNQLEVHGLGRVNLLVGHNNAGKTTFLEALRLYASAGAPSVILEFLQSRDEVTFLQDADLELERRQPSLEGLFHGRMPLSQIAEHIAIGPAERPEDMVRIRFVWYAEQLDVEKNTLTRRRLTTEDAMVALDRRPGLEISRGAEPPTLFPWPDDYRRTPRYYDARRTELLPSVFLSAQGMRSSQLGQLWDTISLTDLEDHAISALRVLSPNVSRLSFVGREDRNMERIAMVRLEHYDAPVPLRSLGGGLNRVLSIALGLVSSANGVFLVDEIENGIHFSVQEGLWRLIFEVAESLNVQVFATTHSSDAVNAFSCVSREYEAVGTLVRLSDTKHGVVAAVLSEEQLGIATRQEIEIR